MIRLFNVYYSTRTLVLLLCEALIVSGSFLLATTYLIGSDTYIALMYENGLLKIGSSPFSLCCSLITLICMNRNVSQNVGRSTFGCCWFLALFRFPRGVRLFSSLS